MFTIRPIEKNTSDPPKNFALVEAASYEDGLAAISKAMEDEYVDLVVWQNAGDLLPADFREQLPDFLKKNNMSASEEGKWGKAEVQKSVSDWEAEGRPNIILKAAFNELARKSGPSSLFDIWQEHRRNLVSAFTKTWGRLESFSYNVHSCGTDKLKRGTLSGAPHIDMLEREEIRLVMSPLLPATLFAETKDCGRFMGHARYELNKDATLWMPQQWAIAAFGAYKQGPLHVNPNPDYYKAPLQCRALEIIDFKGSKPFFDDPRFR